MGMTRRMSLVFSGLALALIGLGLLALRIGPRITKTSEISCLVVGGAALLVSAIIFWKKVPVFSWKHLALVLFFALVLLGASLAYHDDYSGGEFGYSIHTGFPYSWREGFLYYGEANSLGISVTEYIATHPQVVNWTLDGKALVVDSLFWINCAVIIVGSIKFLFYSGKTKAARLTSGDVHHLP